MGIKLLSLRVSVFLQFDVLQCCEAEQRMFRASSSSVLFHFMLLLGLLMAAAAPIIDFHLVEGTNKYTLFHYSSSQYFQYDTICFRNSFLSKIVQIVRVFFFY